MSSIITNLGTLGKIFPCFIHLINYQFFDIPQEEMPMVVSHYEPGWTKLENNSDTRKNYVVKYNCLARLYLLPQKDYLNREIKYKRRNEFEIIQRVPGTYSAEYGR